MPKQRTQQKITGYGQKLAEAMRRARITQSALAELASISRQTLSKALNADEISPRTERQIAAALSSILGAAPKPKKESVDRTHTTDRLATAHHSAEPRVAHIRRVSSRGAQLHLAARVDATELTRWADRRTAQAELPELIRRLILSTHQPSTIAVRAGEGVQLPGWDAVVVARPGDAFVPAGQSGWELGVSKGVKRKADADYEKRSAESGDLDPAMTTFVFVTPRRWRDKGAWAKRRRAEKVWFDVRAYDADDLETWLERSPAVHLWLSALLGAPVDGATDLQATWDQWSKATSPPLTEAFILAGRDETTKAITAWMQTPQSPLVLRAESREEAIAVFVASIMTESPNTVATHMARSLVVHDGATWRRLTAAQEPLILVPLFEVGDLAAAAARAGHAVMVPLSREEPSLRDDGIEVLPIDVRIAVPTLVASGIADDVANGHAALARRSLMALRRQLAITPIGRQPAWAQPSNGRSMLPAMFAGRWTETSARDRDVIAALGQAPYDEIRDRLLSWAERPDPPIRRREVIWFLVSVEDSWRLLSRYVLPDDLERFGPIAIQILADPDPQYTLAVERRWMANVLGEVPQYSALLRQGIAQTLAIMGAGTGTTQLDSTVAEFACGVVRRILDLANTDWRIWASLSHVLQILAEAAPEEFLNAVERGTEGDEPVLAQLFTDNESSPFFGTSPHVYLLWALERIGWSSRLLGRVAQLLARLIMIDPGGKTSNRPEASLRSLFRPWYPQTSASVDQRVRVIEGIRLRYPDVAWRLFKSMLPERHGSAMNNPRPRWREWAPDAPIRVASADYIRMIDTTVSALREMAGRDGQRWSELVKALPHLDVKNRDVLLVALDAEASALDSAQRTVVSDALRAVVSQHRSFPQATWAMPSDVLDTIDAVRVRLEPRNGPERFAWLFTHHPDLPEGRGTGPGRLDSFRDTVDARRREAIELLLAQSGLNGVLQLASAVVVPAFVGHAAASLDALQRVEGDLLRAHLAAEDNARALFAFGFANHRVQVVGPQWVERKLADSALPLAPMQRVQLLRLLPADPATWVRVDDEQKAVQVAYWNGVQTHELLRTDPAIPVHKLLERGRVFAAIAFLALAERLGEHHALALEVLDALVASTAVDQPDSSFSYDVATLLDSIAAAPDAADGDATRVAQLEWALLPVIDEHERSPRALHQALSTTPSFFIEVVSLVFRGDQDDEVTEDIPAEDRERAQRGYALLQSWRCLPGQRNDDNSVDSMKLKAWISTARKELAEVHRLGIGEELIGQMLSGSPIDPDGAWPAVAVRDIIEQVKSDELDRGIMIGAYNSRGVVMRSIGEGGAQERSVAECYEGYAALLADTWPRTATLLRRMADSYRHDAGREDHRIALNDDLGD